MTSLKRGRWSTPELARLRELFPAADVERVAELLGRSIGSVRAQGRRLFRRPIETGPWSESDDASLRRGWGVVDLDDLAVILGRTMEELQTRAGLLRESPREHIWTADEIALLKELYGSRSNEALEVCLSRPRSDIEAQARRLCLSKDKKRGARGVVRMPRWSNHEIDHLVRAYPERSNLEIARAIGRSVVSVANKASQLGLVKSERARSRVAAANAAARRRR